MMTTPSNWGLPSLTPPNHQMNHQPMRSPTPMWNSGSAYDGGVSPDSRAPYTYYSSSARNPYGQGRSADNAPMGHSDGSYTTGDADPVTGADSDAVGDVTRFMKGLADNFKKGVEESSDATSVRPTWDGTYDQSPIEVMGHGEWEDSESIDADGNGLPDAYEARLAQEYHLEESPTVTPGYITRLANEIRGLKTNGDSKSTGSPSASQTKAPSQESPNTKTTEPIDPKTGRPLGRMARKPKRDWSDTFSSWVDVFLGVSFYLFSIASFIQACVSPHGDGVLFNILMCAILGVMGANVLGIGIRDLEKDYGLTDSGKDGNYVNGLWSCVKTGAKRIKSGLSRLFKVNRRNLKRRKTENAKLEFGKPYVDADTKKASSTDQSGHTKLEVPSLGARTADGISEAFGAWGRALRQVGINRESGDMMDRVEGYWAAACRSMDEDDLPLAVAELVEPVIALGDVVSMCVKMKSSPDFYNEGEIREAQLMLVSAETSMIDLLRDAGRRSMNDVLSKARSSLGYLKLKSDGDDVIQDVTESIKNRRIGETGSAGGVGSPSVM